MENVRSILLGNRDIQESKRCLRAKDVTACKTYIKVLDAGTIDETILATLVGKHKQSGNNSHLQLGDKMEKASKKAPLSKEEKAQIKAEKESKIKKYRKFYQKSHTRLTGEHLKALDKIEAYEESIKALIDSKIYLNRELSHKASQINALEKCALKADNENVNLKEELAEVKAKNKGLNNTLYSIKREAESILLSTLDKALSPAVTSSHTSKIYKLINNIMGLETKKECEGRDAVGNITYYPHQMPSLDQPKQWGQCPNGLKGSNEI